MQIYLLRHGIAEPARAGEPDAERALTPEGKKKVRDVARAAAAAGVKPTIIVSSPYKRALATARAAAEELGYPADILTSNALTPQSSPAEAWDDIRLHHNAASVLAVGHEPLFSALAAYLLGAAVNVDFKKGALLCLETVDAGPQPRGVLKWLITPKLAGSS
jgi:phosphohistidine phosphatase